MATSTQARRSRARPLAHSRAHLHESRTLGERVADQVAATMGSWRFIIGQSAFILVWIAFNSVAWALRWDPYPWILLNLCMSTQAMYTGPLVMLSQNRQAARDRKRDDLEAKEVASLLKMNQQQLDILHQQNEMLSLLHQLLDAQKQQKEKHAA